MNRFIVPLGGFGILIALAFMLIIAIIVRPWAGPDNSWRTHMNLTEAPYSDYTRSVQSFVSPEGSAPISIWRKAECGDNTGITLSAEAAGNTQDVSLGKPIVDLSPCGDERVVEWVAHGCASCHGLEGTGGVVGPNALSAAEDKIIENIRFGPAGMPAHDTSELSDEQIALITDYIREMRIANPQAVETPTPTPAPTPTATAPVTAEVTVTPTPASSSGSSNSSLFAQGKLIFEETAGDVGCAYCHGMDGKGEGEAGESAPDIRGMQRSQVRSAVRDVLDMKDIKLSSEELAAVVEYLQYLKEQP